MEAKVAAATRNPLPAEEHYLPLGTVEFSAHGSEDGSPQTTSSQWTHGRLSEIPVERTHHLYTAIESLEKIHLIRLAYRQAISDGTAKLRIYLLPQDVDRSRYPHLNPHHRLALKTLMIAVNRSPSSWRLEEEDQSHEEKYESPPAEHHSLFYIFNTLDSPQPDPMRVKDSRIRDLMDGILNNSIAVTGLRTSLYPYQRRSAAVMIQRETRPRLMLDPTLVALRNPTGQQVYVDKHSTRFLSGKVEYEEARGGILAETMGLGKTLICLTTILATRGDYPEIPPEYQDTSFPLRPTVASLRQMAASAIIRAQLPWRQYFWKRLRQGEDYAGCVSALKLHPPSYWLPPRGYWQRKPPQRGTRILAAPLTLIVVPDNLISQWQHEVERHVEIDGMSVYVFDDPNDRLPHASELLPHDVLLMTKTSFKKEMSLQFRLSQQPDYELMCDCPPVDTAMGPVCLLHRNSPLRTLHFLRIIVDEGHQFASSGLQSKFLQAVQEIHVERRWIVSGTPSGSRGLMGVEVELAAARGDWQETHETLALRKSITSASDERKDLTSLGLIVTRFLRMQPWCNPRASGNDFASWNDVVLPTERREVPLRGILGSLIVRHRIQDIEAELPPLHNRVVHLQPSYFDKLSINLFVLFLTANAVTSERVDQDYMFHPKNRKDLDALIRNLRHSGFYWTGHDEKDLQETLRVSVEYLTNPDRHPSDADRALLESAVHHGREALQSSAWTALSKQDEMGTFVEHFPADATDAWALCHASDPLLLSAAQLRLAQKYVDEHLYASDPLDGLAATGKASAATPASASRPKSTKRKLLSLKPEASGLHGLPRVVETSNADLVEREERGLKSSLKVASASTISVDSPVVRAQLCGTASAKLSYLVDRIAQLHTDEKILVFYEADHIAWYIAQALEIIHVEHLIYGGGISNSRLTVYLETFSTTDKFRVMLMDLRKAAQGLHVAAASRVFFVNPVWQPTVEAQAIKRAHRIGQTRPVYVETLILKDTLEDHMFQRRTAMTSQEHQQASKSLLDDHTMSDLIKNASLIPDLEAGSYMAPLEHKQQIFARGAMPSAEAHPDDDLVIPIPSKMNARFTTTASMTSDPSIAGVLAKPKPDLRSPGASPAPGTTSEMGSSQKRKVNFGALDLASVDHGEEVNHQHSNGQLPYHEAHVTRRRKVAFASPSPPSPAAQRDIETAAEPRKKRTVDFDLSRVTSTAAEAGCQ